VDVAIVGGDLGDDHGDRIVRSVSLNNNRIVRVEMCQDGGLGEGSLDGFDASVWSGPQVNRVSLGEQIRE